MNFYKSVNPWVEELFKIGGCILSALGNAFKIIELVVDHQAVGLSFTQILQESGLPRSSSHRLLKELTALNLLTFEAETKTYRGGFALAALGAQVVSNFDIRQNCRPALKALHDALGYVVTLSICGEDSGIYIDKIEARDFGIRLHSEIGKSFPLHCTAMGKIHLAFGPQKLRDTILSSGLDAFTEATITSPVTLTAELERVRAQGYAVDNEEISRGLTCIGAPIFGVDGKIIAALSLTAPSYIYERGIPSSVINTVQSHAAQASLK